MNLLRSFLLLALVGATLAGCGSVRESLGLGRSAPDEFAVVDRPPLAMPPDFGLRPPTPGAPRPQEVDANIHAKDTLFGASETPVHHGAGASSAEQALLEQTGADKASSDIRATINNESTTTVDTSPHLLDELLWWKEGAKSGSVVDAAGETTRIKEAKEKGEPLNSGATPVIEKEKTGWLGL